MSGHRHLGQPGPPALVIDSRPCPVACGAAQRHLQRPEPGLSDTGASPFGQRNGKERRKDMRGTQIDKGNRAWAEAPPLLPESLGADS